MKFARESWILTVICLVDLTTTMWLVSNHGAREGNTVMNYFLNWGYVPFIGAKLLMFLAPLALLEWARRRNPKFVTGMLRFAIVLYLAIYCAGVYRINTAPSRDPLQAQYAALIDRWASKPASKSSMLVNRTNVLNMMPADLHLD
jgi:hypothetical protein